MLWMLAMESPLESDSLAPMKHQENPPNDGTAPFGPFLPMGWGGVHRDMVKPDLDVLLRQPLPGTPRCASSTWQAEEMAPGLGHFLRLPGPRSIHRCFRAGPGHDGKRDCCGLKAPCKKDPWFRLLWNGAATSWNGAPGKPKPREFGSPGSEQLGRLDWRTASETMGNLHHAASPVFLHSELGTPKQPRNCHEEDVRDRNRAGIEAADPVLPGPDYQENEREGTSQGTSGRVGSDCIRSFRDRQLRFQLDLGREQPPRDMHQKLDA
eukprot:gene15825-biopygen4413